MTVVCREFCVFVCSVCSVCMPDLHAGCHWSCWSFLVRVTPSRAGKNKQVISLACYVRGVLLIPTRGGRGCHLGFVRGQLLPPLLRGLFRIRYTRVDV